MRRFLPFLLLLGLLAACSSPSEPAPPAGATIEHAFGSTTVPEKPARIVTLGVSDADAVLALGRTPVAVTGYVFYQQVGGLGPWARDLIEGDAPELLVSDSEPDLERIAALQPDLIVGISAGFDQTVYDRLSAIAPTVARPAGSVAYTVSRDDQTRVIAQAMGEQARGEELIARANAAYTEAVAAHPAFAGKTGTVVLPFDGVYGAYTPGDARGQVMEALGFSLPASVAAADTGEHFFVEVAPERVGILDGDVLVMLADQPAARAAIDADPVLAQVPVVAQGRMVVPDTDTRGAITYNSVLSVPYALNSLVPQLAAALE